MAHSQAHTARITKDQCKTHCHLHYTITKAKRTWAHNALHEAAESQDIWCMASVQKGRRTHAFPPLRNAANEMVDDPELKVSLFKVCFFPTNPITVNATQPDDPPPRPTRTYPDHTRGGNPFPQLCFV
jgi:hypothetical protein